MPDSESRFRDCSIELDCPPGSPRPSDLIEGVLKDTGLVVEDFNTSAPFFGNQSWILKIGSKDALFTSLKPVFEKRLQELYAAGIARYVSW